jgi:hypothetical protein
VNAAAAAVGGRAPEHGPGNRFHFFKADGWQAELAAEGWPTGGGGGAGNLGDSDES